VPTQARNSSESESFFTTCSTEWPEFKYCRYLAIPPGSGSRRKTARYNVRTTISLGPNDEIDCEVRPGRRSFANNFFSHPHTMPVCKHFGNPAR
jgi:hypothetical protein